jgi:hypothetical protein
MKTASNSRVLRTILLLIAFCLIDIPAYAKYSGGTGEPNDPYKIATAADLMLLGETPEDYDKHFILTVDIDMDPNLSRRKVFDRAVIAPSTGVVEGRIQRTTFSGVFNGYDHKISNLTFHSTGQTAMKVGLFGWVADPNAEIMNLGLFNPHVYAEEIFCAGPLVDFLGGNLRNCYVAGGGITGLNDYIGGIVGDNNGKIVDCYSTCTVAGDHNIGGLAGGNSGRMTNCYSTGSVTGRRDVGGLVGYNASLIANCYSVGLVNGDENVGGLVGRTIGLGRSHASAEISCFWDIETSGQTQSAGGTGKTTAEMQTASTFHEAGWDFVDETTNGTEDIWWILEGQDYPRLWWELVPEN